MATTRNRSRQSSPKDPVVAELDSIKRLLAVLLMKAGTKQSEIAAALNIDQGDLSRMLPARKFKPFASKEKTS